MASSVMKGKAIVETSVGAMDVYAGVTNEQLQAAHAWESEEIKDDKGFDMTWIARNENFTMSVEIKLTGASKAAAATAAVFLAPYAAVTLSGFTLSWMNAVWQYVGGTTINLSASKHGTANIKLRKYADATQNTASHTDAT